MGLGVFGVLVLLPSGETYAMGGTDQRLGFVDIAGEILAFYRGSLIGYDVHIWISLSTETG
jgi:hypothetical protein